MLTDKQTDSLDLYYNQDLSLAEIAEHLHITRQGVRDNIKRGEKQLLEYEENLGLANKFASIMSICDSINENIETLQTAGLADSAVKCVLDISSNIKKIENLI